MRGANRTDKLVIFIFVEKVGCTLNTVQFTVFSVLYKLYTAYFDFVCIHCTLYTLLILSPISKNLAEIQCISKMELGKVL